MRAPLIPEELADRYADSIASKRSQRAALRIGYLAGFDVATKRHNQQTAALREELAQIMKLCGVEHVNGEGGALVVVSYILKERKELSAWKKDQIATFSPLLDYGQSPASGLQLGVSIVGEAINALKDRKVMWEQLEVVKKERDKWNFAYEDMTQNMEATHIASCEMEKELEAVKKERDEGVRLLKYWLEEYDGTPPLEDEVKYFLSSRENKKP